MFKYLLTIILLISGTVESFAQGISFNSNIIAVNKRTSLELFTNEKNISAKQKVMIDFEIRINDINQYGCIAQIFDNAKGNIYSLTYSSLRDNEYNFRLNLHGAKNLCTFNLVADSISGIWLPVSLIFDNIKKTIQISLDKQTFSIANVNFEKEIIPEIFFGLHGYILDVPDFTIRNLNIQIDSHKTIFPLNEKDGNIVHDQNGEAKGRAVNPKWEIARAYRWETLYSKNSTKIGGIQFDNEKQCFYIFTQDSIDILSLSSNVNKSICYKNNIGFEIKTAKSFIDFENEKLGVYEVRDLPENSSTIEMLNLNSLEWEPIGKARAPMQLHHHNGYINPLSNNYTLFGGFGDNKYSNKFYEYNPKTDSWDTINFTGDLIEPRYFSGAVIDKERQVLYIYGGMGNEAGDHSIGRTYFNDLHEINLKNNTIKECWSFDRKKEQVSVSNMILSDDKASFFTLCYPEYLANSFLQLNKFDIKSGKNTLLGDSIPIISEKIQTNANLFYNNERSEFYCAIYEMQNNKSNMRILRLASPAISWTELNKLQSTPAKQWHNYIFISIACLLGAYFASLRIRYALKNKIKEDKYIETDSQEINIPEKQTLLGECCKNIQLIESVNSVYLFGAFKVFDSLGEDISGLFTSRVKLIFIYIILNSRNKGVLSSTLNDLFWADKPVDKARNIKGVTINQIRKIISSVEGVELTFEKGYYRINFTTCYCDYWHYLDLQNAEFSEKDMEIIFLSGRFLEGLDSIVLDKYKLQVEEFASVYIPKRIEYNYSKMEDRGVLRFCRILSQVDPLNETALIYTIISLNRLKRLQDSAIHYASFANLYKQMMGEEYYHSYTSICEQKTKIISED